MKLIKSLLLFLSFIFSFTDGNAQCDDCSRPRVALYDCDVQIERPTDPEAIKAWQILFWPSAAARSYMHTNDPTKECITWYDGALINAQELQGDTLKFGSEWANLPSGGTLKSSDYLIYSTVTGSGESYIFTLILEASESREVVKSLQYQFAANVENANLTGQQAAMDIMPLFQTIRDFEVNKRNNDVMVAIRDHWSKDTPDEIIIKPAKYQLDTDEEIDVQVTMTDCDGVPLSNRTLYFHDETITLNDEEYTFPGTTGGEVTPASAITDGSGKVTVRFKAKSEAGTGNIVAWYPHYKPNGKAGAFEGTSMVMIKVPPPTLWLLTASVNFSYSMHYDTSYSVQFIPYSWIHEFSGRKEIKTNAKLKAVIENISEDPENNFGYNTDAVEPLSLQVSGSGFMDEYSKSRETIMGTLVHADIRNDYVSGFARPWAGIELDFSQDYNHFGVSIGIKATGSYKGNTYQGQVDGWHEWGGNYSDYSLSASGGCYIEESGCSLIKTENGYSGSWNFTEEEAVYDPYQKGTRFITRNKTLEFTLFPYGSYTDIKDDDMDKIFPSTFALEQNYPNPFNPSTIIRYQVSGFSPVSLVVYDILGNKIETLVNEEKHAGEHEIIWDAPLLPSGVYFYQLKSGDYLTSKKMILIR
jgi:hypothetical protein